MIGVVHELARLAVRSIVSRASRFVTGEGLPARLTLVASRPPAASLERSSVGPRPPARGIPLPYDPQPLDGMLVTDGSWCALTGCPNRGDTYRNHVPWCLAHYEAGTVIAHLEAHFGART